MNIVTEKDLKEMENNLPESNAVALLIDPLLLRDYIHTIRVYREALEKIISTEMFPLDMRAIAKAALKEESNERD